MYKKAIGNRIKNKGGMLFKILKLYSFCFANWPMKIANVNSIHVETLDNHVKPKRNN